MIGIPDDRLGEIATVIVSVRDGEECTEEELAVLLGAPTTSARASIYSTKCRATPPAKSKKKKLRENTSASGGY